MIETIEPAMPETRLAIGYVPSAGRRPLAILFALDERLGGLVARTGEATIGLIRLTWWRDALEALDRDPAPAEPLLQAAASLRAHGVAGAELAALTEGWEALLEEEAERIDRHAGERGARLFALAARLIGEAHPQVEAAGRGWALADLARHSRDRALAAEALSAARAPLDAAMAGRWPRRLRPLGMLAALAREDALRGADNLAPPASPRRLLRILRHQISGR